MWNTILQTAIAGTERRPLPTHLAVRLGLSADADFWDVAAAARLMHKAAGPQPFVAELSGAAVIEATPTGENPSKEHKSTL
ncbi:MAG: hypothetical protein SFV52_14675 [Saprospiraceae bacterium]|nr:hypothetical protein [Saprospiraceae bacterium]